MSPLGGGIDEKHADLAVVHPAGGPAILARHPHAVLARLKKAGFIHHENGLRIAALLNHVGTQIVAYLIRRPGRTPEQMLHPIGRRITGTIVPRPHAGGRMPSCDEAALEVVRRLLREQADATLEELRDRLRQQRGLWVSVSTMSRLLRRLGLPRKRSRSTPPNVTRHGSKRRARTTSG
jgi:hypothetical protein